MYAKSSNTYSKTSSRGNAGREAEKYCSACFKAGKDKSTYTSHYVKSVPGPKGIIVCPTILSASCKYCGESGHWANEKHCPAMRSDIKNKTEFVRVESRKSAGFSSNSKIENNENRRGGFSSLCDSSSDSEDEKVITGVKRARFENLPVVSAVVPVKASLPKAGVSWAAMASSLPVKPEEKTVDSARYYYTGKDDTNGSDEEKQKEAFKIINERRREAFSRIQLGLSWTDKMYDSSDDEEEEDEDERVDRSAW